MLMTLYFHCSSKHCSEAGKKSNILYIIKVSCSLVFKLLQYKLYTSFSRFTTKLKIFVEFIWEKMPNFREGGATLKVLLKLSLSWGGGRGELLIYCKSQIKILINFEFNKT